MSRPVSLRPEMGLRSTTLLIIGSMVGSGIFFVPAAMVLGTGSVSLVLLAFLVGGLLSLCGALVLAELAAAYPRAGGQAVYIREAFGRFPAFLFTWSSFAGIQSGAIAAIAVAFAATAHTLWGLPGQQTALGWLTLPAWGVSFTAVGVVWLLTALNHVGVRHAARFNDAATVAKLAGIGLVVAAALWFAFGGGGGSLQDAARPFELPATVGWGALGIAVAAGLFAYDGWAQPTFVASEVRDARRNVPRALVLGVTIVMAVYLLAAWAYFTVVPTEGLTPDTPLAEGTARQVWGPAAGLAVGVAVLVSTLGATNAYVLASPRIYYDEAREGQFPAAFGKLSRHRTPGYGLVYQGLLASLLALTGTFEQLLYLVVLVVYLFYIVTAAGYWRLRRRRPGDFDGFRMPLWPVPFLVFVLVSAAVMINLAVTDVRTTVWTAVLLLAGVPVYMVMARVHPKPTPEVK